MPAFNLARIAFICSTSLRCELVIRSHSLTSSASLRLASRHMKIAPEWHVHREHLVGAYATVASGTILLFHHPPPYYLAG